MAELEIESLKLRFGGLVVLDGISLAADGGRIAGADRPERRRQDQRAELHQRHLSRRGRHPLSRQKCERTSAARDRAAWDRAHVPARRIVSANDGVGNLLVGRHARIRTNPIAEMLFLPSVRREEMRQREAVEKIIDFVELERYRHTPVGGLPFGTQKIVGFARALALEPALLLLDEPSAGLNRDEREDLARFILRIKHQLGIAMIWIEHDMQMVADLADRIHVLNYGRTIAEGASDVVFANPDVVRAYLGNTQGLSRPVEQPTRTKGWVRFFYLGGSRGFGRTRLNLIFILK